MTEKFKNVTLREDKSFLFDSKKLNLRYTICILKPNLVMNTEDTQKVISTLEEKGFEIRFVLQRPLTIQEAENLYFKHKDENYFRELIICNTTGPSVVLLLSHTEVDPILELKKFAGDKNPEKAKVDSPDSIRGLYGEDLINNAVYWYLNN